MMRPTSGRFAMILLAAFLLLTLVGEASADASPLHVVTLLLPATNLPAGGSAASDKWLVYSLSDPLIHINSAQSGLFTNFHARVFLVRLTSTARRLQASPPRLLFTGPRGQAIDPAAIAQGWLVYCMYNPDDVAAPWVLAARNVTTGRVIVLDTSAAEGVPSLAPDAASDGHTVVWQTYTRARGTTTSVLWSLDLRTHHRRRLIEGGSLTTFTYGWPRLSGRWVVFEKEEPYASPRRAQILMADLWTGRIRALTSTRSANSEPSISGDLVSWKRGWRYAQGTGVAVYSIRTERVRVLPTSNVEAPQAVGGHVVFPAGNPTAVYLYDVASGRTRLLAGSGPDAQGYQPGNLVRATEHVAEYWLAKLSPSALPNPTRLVVTMLP